MREIFADPQHPYTIGLMGSLPSLDRPGGAARDDPGQRAAPRAHAERLPLRAALPLRASRACTTAPPPLIEVAPGHEAACIRAPLELHVTEAA